MSDGMHRETQVPISDDDLLTDTQVNAILGELTTMHRIAITRHMMARERLLAKQIKAKYEPKPPEPTLGTLHTEPR